MKSLMMSTAAVILATGVAFAQSSVGDNAENPGKGTNMQSSSEQSGKMQPGLDTDGDGMISRDEFRASMGDNAFGGWDTDDDGMLSRSEYEAGVGGQDNGDSFATWDDRYSGWDEDQDEMLSADEYDQGLWTQYDADQDDLWNDEESAAWEEDEMRYDATRSGREVSQ
jgi:hypothetical protein